MLETLHEPDIRHMVNDDPERESRGWFDPAEYIGEREAKMMEQYLMDCVIRNSWLNFSDQLVWMKELGLPVQPNPAEIAILEAVLNKYRKQKKAIEFIHMFSNAKKLNLPFIYTPEDQIWVMENLPPSLDLSGMDESNIGKNLQDLGMEIEIFKKRDAYSNLLQSFRRAEVWTLFSSMARNMVEMGMDPQITSGDIEMMKQEFLSRIKDGVAAIAANMNYLSSHSTAKKTDLEANAPMPIEREF